jgi:Domain of unknown function (DUF1707)
MHKRQSHHRAVRPRAAAPAPSGPVRVGDAERERVVELLRGHAIAGRLDADELEERLERAYAARYGAELQAVLAELPTEPERRRGPARRSHSPRALLLPIALAALIGAAALSGAWWLLWLIWPLVVVLGPRRHHHRHRATRA